MDWKYAIVTPIFKGGDPLDMSNYRPISLISNIAKLFEKCIKQKLVKYLEANNIIFDKQYGFRSGKSTQDAIFCLTSSILQNFNSNKKSLAVFLDIAKAFDTVSHAKLLNKLENIGVRGAPLALFRNYISNRKQKVKIGNILSDPQPITTGVPQGTTLGPILFLIYINGIKDVATNGSIIAYADDTAIVFTGNSWDEAYEAAEQGLCKIREYLDDGLLTLNIKKTSFITFTLTSVDQPQKNYLLVHSQNCLVNNICQNCPKINRISYAKYLGINVDQHLRWKEHIDLVKKKIRSMFHKFYQLREFLEKNLLITLYYSLVESILRYCIIVWGSSFNNIIKSLEVCQKKILKIILKRNN